MTDTADDDNGQPYDAAANSAGSYALAIAEIRLRGVKAGRFLPEPDNAAEVKASPIVTAARRFGSGPGAVVLYCGDCTKITPLLAEQGGRNGWIDACVTDPPYELGFMGRAWDSSGVAADWRTWGAVRIALKPGAHLVAFAGSRTYHRIATAIDDAGFEIRDQFARFFAESPRVRRFLETLAPEQAGAFFQMLEERGPGGMLSWLYGSGFPKSHDISKALDKERDESQREVRRDIILTVTQWIREARDAAGLTNKDLDAAFETRGMAGHWTSSKSQPAVPTQNQWPLLLDLLKVEAPPPEVRAAVEEWLRIKGQPAPTWSLREVTGTHERPAMGQQWRASYGDRADLSQKERRDRPATDAAAQWEGWGTALKPGHEPVCFARKPLSEGTVAANVLRWGVGALNVDAARIETAETIAATRNVALGSSSGGVYGGADKPGVYEQNDAGRWPANVFTDGSVSILETFPAAARDAVRFFYAPKADKAEREFGLDKVPRRRTGAMKATENGSMKTGSGNDRTTARANIHPTVKPVDLMRWLIRLVVPPGGVVLDPFMGSGSTGIAAVREGCGFVGCEQSPEYFEIACARIGAAVAEIEDGPPDLVRELNKATRALKAKARQEDLF